MNIEGPFFNPFLRFQNISEDQSNYEKITNKLERLEKSIRILENRMNKLEKKEIKDTIYDEPTDMYMI